MEINKKGKQTFFVNNSKTVTYNRNWGFADNVSPVN